MNSGEVSKFFMYINCHTEGGEILCLPSYLPCRYRVGNHSLYTNMSTW